MYRKVPAAERYRAADADLIVDCAGPESGRPQSSIQFEHKIRTRLQIDIAGVQFRHTGGRESRAGRKRASGFDCDRRC
jgi:hypothetical protein